MATEKIKLLELDIDVDKVLKASKDLKDETVDLKKEMKKLKDQGEENSQEYVELEARYKSVRSEYNSSQRDLGKLINLQGKEIKTIEQGRNALSIISKEWAKQAELYGENSVEAEKLAQKKTDLTSRLKELEGATGDNRRQVGGYKDAIKAAAGELGFFGQVQNDVNNIFKSGAPLLDKLRGYFKGAGKDFKAATANTKGYTGAQKAAFVATKATAGGLKILKGALLASGIGAFVVVLGTVVAALGTMKAALSKTEEGQNKLNRITAKFSGFLNGVLKALEPVANFIFNNVIVALETMGEVANKSMDLVADGLAALGFDQAAKNIKGFKDELQSSGAAAQDLAKASAELQKEQRKANKLQLDYQTKAEKLRQLRDDESKSLKERAKANEDLGQLLKKQANEELDIARKALEVSNLKIKAEGESTEALDERAEAELKIAEINERITSQESEQLTNLNQLRKDAHSEYMELQKEAIEAAKQVTDAAISESKTRLEIFIEENKGKADNLKDSISIEEEVRDRKIQILNDELEAKKLTQSEFELAVLQTKNNFLEKQKELTVEYANEDIRIQKQKESELNDMQAAKKEQEQLDFENRMAAEEGNFLGQLELEEQRMKQRHARELELAKQQGLDLKALKERQAKEEEGIEKAKQEFKVGLASQTFGNLATILGKETKLGKAAAIAQTTIDTYQSAQAAYKALAGIPVVGPALGAIAAGAAVASGLKAVQKITSTQAPQVPSGGGGGSTPRAAKGATLKGPSHAGGGMNLYDDNGRPVVNAEGDENIYVLNKRASGLINSLSYMNQATGGIPLSRTTTFAAAGGMIQRPVTVNQGGANQGVDYDLLASKMAQANRSLPRPVVSVEDINTGQNDYAQVVNGANI